MSIPLSRTHTKEDFPFNVPNQQLDAPVHAFRPQRAQTSLELFPNRQSSVGWLMVAECVFACSWHRDSAISGH